MADRCYLFAANEIDISFEMEHVEHHGFMEYKYAIPLFWLALFSPRDLLREKRVSDTTFTQRKRKKKRSGLSGWIKDLFYPVFVSERVEMKGKSYWLATCAVAREKALEQLRQASPFIAASFHGRGDPAPYIDLFAETVEKESANHDYIVLNFTEILDMDNEALEKVSVILEALSSKDPRFLSTWYDLCGLDSLDIPPLDSTCGDDESDGSFLLGYTSRVN